MHPAAAIVRKPVSVALFLAAGLAATLLLLVYGAGPHAAKASSHSEAPLISQDPRADNTDLYAFVSPEDTSKVTIIANYIPLEAPASGPNFYSFDDSVLYEIKVDNNGDGKDDIGYQFRFHTATVDPNTFLYAKLPIGFANGAYTNWNRPQTYDVTLVHFKKDGKISAIPSIGRQEQAGRPRYERPDSARQRRAADDAELRRVGGARHLGSRERRQGLRRSARRSVLRRPRLDLRSRRAAAVQPVPPAAASRGAGCGRAEELQHALDRDPGADLAAHGRRAPDDRRLRVVQPAEGHAFSRTTARRTGTVRGCRSRASASRSSTRS